MLLLFCLTSRAYAELSIPLRLFYVFIFATSLCTADARNFEWTSDEERDFGARRESLGGDSTELIESVTIRHKSSRDMMTSDNTGVIVDVDEYVPFHPHKQPHHHHHSSQSASHKLPHHSSPSRSSSSYRFLSRLRRDSTADQQRFCGEKLIGALRAICGTKGHQGTGCPERGNTSLIRNRREEKKQKTTQMCCEKKCSMNQLKTLCCQ